MDLKFRAFEENESNPKFEDPCGPVKSLRVREAQFNGASCAFSMDISRRSPLCLD
jgi:hypothetical protein